MWHEDDPVPDKNNEEELRRPVCPKTPRSILVGGSMDVCIAQSDCEKWQDCGGKDQPECCDHQRIPLVAYCAKDVG
jgi:hypothetical protein